MSYVLEGEIGHRDTLGTVSRVKAGGAQVMQTGSGVSHEEETLGNHTNFFQIWFEPHLQEAVKRPPTYGEFHHEDFPVLSQDGVTLKSIIGKGGPVALVAPVQMQEMTVVPGKQFVRTLQKGMSLAALTIKGKGTWHAHQTDQQLSVDLGDFAVIRTNVDTGLTLKADGTGSFAGSDHRDPIRSLIPSLSRHLSPWPMEQVKRTVRNTIRRIISS